MSQPLSSLAENPESHKSGRWSYARSWWCVYSMWRQIGWKWKHTSRSVWNSLESSPSAEQHIQQARAQCNQCNYRLLHTGQIEVWCIIYIGDENTFHRMECAASSFSWIHPDIHHPQTKDYTESLTHWLIIFSSLLSQQVSWVETCLPAA